MRRHWLGLLFLSGVVLAQPKEYTVKEITDRMQKKYESIQDATARFTQHVRFG